LPEALPQFFVSELHVERFDMEFGLVAAAVFGDSDDPLCDTAKARDLLARFAAMARRCRSKPRSRCCRRSSRRSTASMMRRR
jgi:hypothetical protein